MLQLSGRKLLSYLCQWVAVIVCGFLVAWSFTLGSAAIERLILHEKAAMSTQQSTGPWQHEEAQEQVLDYLVDKVEKLEARVQVLEANQQYARDYARGLLYKEVFEDAVKRRK